jgi:hypothetical protein
MAQFDTPRAIGIGKVMIITCALDRKAAVIAMDMNVAYGT